LKQGVSTFKVIKIKEIFLSLEAKKIDQINNIVKSTPKTKPHIQMSTKGLSRKHIIIPMSSENITKFIKNSSLHVTNINRSLRNVKSKVLTDFIQSYPLEIMVVTNKIASQLDLQIIKHYVKNADNINSLHVKVL